MTAILKYRDYILYTWMSGYKSEINGEWVEFDTAGQWKKYIDLLTR